MRAPSCCFTVLASSLAVSACDRAEPRPAPIPAPAIQPAAPLAAPLDANSPAAQPGATKLPSGSWRYTIRGRIVALPKPTGVSRDLQIHHEALTAFYDRADKDVGMKEMVMDFPSIAPGVALDSLGPGDVVVFDLDVDWSVRDFTKVYVVTRLAKLPAGTKLRLAEEAPK